MLIIRHRTGPLAGKEERPTGREEGRIVFGRDPNVCDVVFPPDATAVSRRHFALVRKLSGDWTIDLFGAPYVAVDGEPADLGAPLRSGAVVQLGDDHGPTFEVEIPAEDKAGALPVTQAQKVVAGSHAAAGRAERSARRARQVALVGVVLALVVAAGLGGLYYLAGAADRQFTHEIELLRARQERLASESIPREYRDRLAQAAFYVLVRDADGRERWAGTAFPIGPNMLATNAHVAVNREGLPPGGKLLVRAPGSDGRIWEVVWHKLHPGYRALDAFLHEDPLLVETIKSEDNPWGAQFLTAGNSYDVALLRVEGPSLSPVLEIARPDEILKLSAGDPLAYAGYPSQNIVGSEVQRMGPTPQLRTGLVTAMTDLFTMPADAAYRRLVHHNLGTTVGTSGSPIISSSGRVVALHNRSTYVSSDDGPSVPIAVVAYAQRADMLLDLISGRAEETLAAERAYWRKQTAAMRRGVDVIVPAILEANRPQAGAQAVVASQDKITLSAADRVRMRNGDGDLDTLRRRQHSFKLQRGGQHLFVAYAQKSTPISLYISVGGKIVAKQDSERWYPALAYKAPADASVDVSVVAPDDDVTYTLTDYLWEPPKS